jgi:hypothetical protein
MPAFKFDRRTVKTIATPSATVTYWDETLPGFGLRCHPSGKRTWIIEYRPGEGGRGIAKKRFTIADESTMPPDKARNAAKDLLGSIRNGADPASARATELRVDTLAAISEVWMRDHISIKRKPGTVTNYRGHLDLHILPRLGTRRMSTITRSDCEKLHADIAKQGEKTKDQSHPVGGKGVANRVISTLSSLFGWAERTGRLPEGTLSPTRHVERPTGSRDCRYTMAGEGG